MVLVTILTIFFIIVAAALVLIVLVQRPQGGGLSGAFGGAGGGSDTVFGGRTGDALTLATVVAFVLFLGLSIALNLIEVTPTGTGATTPAANTQPADDGSLDTTLQLPDTGAIPTTPPTQFPANSTTGNNPNGSADGGIDLVKPADITIFPTPGQGEREENTQPPALQPE